MKIIIKVLFFTILILFSYIFFSQFEYFKSLTASIGEYIYPKQTEVQTSEKVKTKISYKSYIDQGDLRASDGYPTLAISQYSKASKLEPSEIEPYLKIGMVHISEKEYAKAIENFRIAAQLNKNDIESKILVGQTYIKLKDFEKANNMFFKVESEDARVYFWKGVMNSFNGEYNDAKFNLEKASKNETATLKSEKAKVDTLIEVYEKFNSSESANIAYLNTMLAKAFNEMDLSELSVELLKKALSENPKYRDAWLLLGYINLKDNQIFDAVESLKKAQEIDPLKPETLFYLGNALKRQNKIDEALKHYEKAYNNGYEPEAEILTELAETYLEQKDYKKSRDYFVKIIEQNTNSIEPFVKAIWISIDYLEDKTTASELASRAVEKFPQDAKSYNLLGWAKTNEEQFMEAKENLDRAIRLNEKLASAYLNLGIWYQKQNDLENAKINLKKAYDLETNTAIGQKAMKIYNEIIQIEANER